MLRLAEIFGVNLAPKEWDLLRIFHAFLYVVDNSMLVGFVLIKNEWCGIHRPSKLGLGFIH